MLVLAALALFVGSAQALEKKKLASHPMRFARADGDEAAGEEAGGEAEEAAGGEAAEEGEEGEEEEGEEEGEEGEEEDAAEEEEEEDSADLGKSIWGVEKTEEEGVFVPFDKQLPNKAGVRYYTASGYQECQLCLNLLEESENYGVQYHDLCSAIPVPKDMVPMCEAQKRTLQSCPEFTNQWCYQDLGGTQQLRAPCPGHLVCHYCLGLNPLHCVTMDANFEED